MKSFYNKNFRLGVLGGGQLGKMFIQEAVNFNVAVAALDPSPYAPCAELAAEFTVGELSDYKTVYNFGKKVDVLTIEIEHVNTEALLQLEEEGIKVFPQGSVLKIVQDKGLQKEFYRKNGIPTADFYLIEKKRDIENYKTQFPFVQKLRKGGYDGRGVTVLPKPDDLDKAFDTPSVLEKKVDFLKEISVIVSRNETGETSTFPVVELEFNPEANLVEYLFSPAAVSDEITEKAKNIALEVIQKLEMTGILAVEMFVTKEGEVLVNEIAPRPHNSGHHTIEANITSQYEQHLRAILGMPPGATDIVTPAVKVNLLGEKGYQGDAVYQGLTEVLKTTGAKIHLYGKKETKPYRKMGHVTVIDKDLNKAKEKARYIKKQLKIISEQ